MGKLREKILSKCSRGFAKCANESVLGFYKSTGWINNFSPYENIFYCCTQRTGSQWFRALFRDRIIFRNTGLEAIPFIHRTDEWKLADCEFEMEIPGRSIITQLYVGYPTYQRIPKPEKYKTFFILRDPRDIVVSWYFSTRYSHKPVSYVPEYRKRLEKMDLKEGLKFTIDVMNLGIFPIQRSWMSGAVHDRNAAIFRFEDFAEDNQKFLAEIFDYLEISLTENERNELTERYAFKKLTRGRSQGAEDRMSHFRKGIAGDWQNYFDASITNYFNRVAGGLLEQLGYRELDS